MPAINSTPGTLQARHFNHPTEITNSFYPISQTGKTISIGVKGGKPVRNEVTLLPDPLIITWAGQSTQVRVVQSVTNLDGKLVQVANEFFAQDDDGSVYCLGQEVANYKDGQLVNHQGSWRAGTDGASPTLVMPVHPQVGQVFHTERLPGNPSETDEILSVTEKTHTPAGPSDQGIGIKESLADGSVEHKIYVANFGLVENQVGDDKVNLVLYHRTDAKPGIVPVAVTTIEAQAEDILDVVPAGKWSVVATDVAAIVKAWQAYQTQIINDQVPQPFQDAFINALAKLQKTSTAQDALGVMHATNDLSAAVVDLYRVYQPVTPPDLGALDVLERAVVFGATDNDLTLVADGLAQTNAIWARLKSVVLSHKGSSTAMQFDKSLMAQQAALDKQNISALTTEARNSLELIDALERLF